MAGLSDSLVCARFDNLGLQRIGLGVLRARPARLLFLLALVPAWLAGGTCRSDPATTPGETVVVGIAPHRYFAGRLLGDSRRVTVLLPPGSNPATYEPAAAQMRALSVSRAYFVSGVPFERPWLARLALDPQRVRTIELNAGLALEDEDPHSWLAPPLAERQVRTMSAALRELYPRETNIDARERELLAELRELHGEIQAQLGPFRGRTLLSMHPTWNYYCRTYGLSSLAVEEHGRERGPREMALLIRRARELGIRSVFSQPEFDQRPARVVARELGGTVVLARPLAEDWPVALREFTAHAVRVLASESSRPPE